MDQTELHQFSDWMKNPSLSKEKPPFSEDMEALLQVIPSVEEAYFQICNRAKYE